MRTALRAADQLRRFPCLGSHDRRRLHNCAHGGASEFLDFMNDIVAAHANTAIHVILDNLNTHKPKNDRWLKSHPNVHLHFTPTRTSWLNQTECWFSILSRQALQGASFVDVKQLREAIDYFISAYNEQAAPFEWRQAEIKQQPLRDNIAYFCK